MLAQVELERCLVQRCAGAAVALHSSSADQAESGAVVICPDSEVADNGTGLVAQGSPDQGESAGGVRALRSRILRNQSAGVLADSIHVTDSLVAANGAGCAVYQGAIVAERSTIAHNADRGLGVADTGWVRVESSIVHGNGDYVPTGSLEAHHSDIGDGDVAGANGNIAADPRFLEAPGGTTAWPSTARASTAAIRSSMQEPTLRALPPPGSPQKVRSQGALRRCSRALFGAASHGRPSPPRVLLATATNGRELDARRDGDS